MAKKTDKNASMASQKVEIHYRKSNLFRIVSGEGIIGSISPHGKIFFVIYSERGAIPKSMTHLVSANGELGEVLETDTIGGLVREMEVGISMSRDDAANLRDWLAGRVEEFDASIAAIEARKNTQTVGRKNVRKSR